MKLLFRNQAYRLLTLSRFFNAFGASIFNLVFIVYASTLSQASFAVAMANIVMIICFLPRFGESMNSIYFQSVLPFYLFLFLLDMYEKWYVNLIF